jgi:hypothetical protein
MQGKRLPDESPPHLYNPLEYGKYNGIFYCLTPNALLGNLANHTIIEHEDGTITVSPSILVGNGDISWHGFIENGLWREAA